MASIQTSRSTPPDCHSDSAKAAASWVLPDDLSQSCASGAPTGPGNAAGAARSVTSATAAPLGSAATRRGAVSSLALKPSASVGTVPDRMGQDGRPGAAPAGPVGGAALLMVPCSWCAAHGLGLAHSASGLKTSTGVVLVSVFLRKKAGAVTRMKTKPITPANAASAAMMKMPPICQCRTGTVHVV